MVPGSSSGCPVLAIDGMVLHLRRRVGAAGVLAVHERPRPAHLFLVDRVVRRIDHEARGCPERRAGHPAQRVVGGHPVGEAVVHREPGGQQDTPPVVTVDGDRRGALGEVGRQPLPEPGSRCQQVGERLLYRHLGAEHPRRALAPCVQLAELAGQDAAAIVELDGHLPGADAEFFRRGGIEDLLDLLQLKEMGARPDTAEAQAAHLHNQPRQFLGGALGAAVRVDVEPATLLDVVQLVFS